MSSITVEGTLMPAAGVLKRGEQATWADTPRLRNLIAKGHLKLISETVDEEAPVELSDPPADPKIGVEPPAKSASTAEWGFFLASQGYVFPEDSSRTYLIELWEDREETVTDDGDTGA